MRRLKGSFTVEASVLVPFLLAVTVIFIYLGIYAYDKTLMIQDVNAVAAMVRDENSIGRDDVVAVCEGAFDEIKEEHPYLSMSNLKLVVTVKGSKVYLQLTGDWNMPLYKGYSRKMTQEREVKRINPVTKMYLTENIKSLLEETEDEDSDDIRD